MRLSLVWLVLVGCGSSTTHAVDAPGSTAAQACADVAHAACTARDTCTDHFASARNYGSEAACETRTALPCVTDLAAPGTSATPETREACAQDYASPDSTCVALLDGDPTPACTPAPGARAQGMACAVSAQCASTFCAVSKDQVCGTCQPLPAVGASCSVDADCGRGLSCETPANAATGTCAAFVAENGACMTGVSSCQADLSCVGQVAAMNVAGTCEQAVTTVGAACDGSRKTMPSCNAQSGLACIPTAAGSAVGTCQPIALVGPGSTCGQIGGPPITVVADCVAGGMCVKALPTDKTGTCVAAAVDGAACDSALGPPCLAPARCVPTTPGGTSGTCTIRDATACH